MVKLVFGNHPQLNGDAPNTYMNDSVRNYHSLIGLFDITILSW
jgi:hypothetical protein